MSKTKRFSLLLSMVLIIVSLMFVYLIGNAESTYTATKAGSLTSISNTTSGIQVKWSKCTTKKGYYIYRKTDTTSWKKVKTITSVSTTKWTDPNVSNGKKYTYKVSPYSGTKVSSNNVTKTLCRLSKPTISSLSRKSSTSINVKASNKSATGFQIKYSTSSSFSSYKTIRVSGSSLDKTLSDLSSLKTYYVKVRAYKTIDGLRHNSAYSSAKYVTTYYTAYTTPLSTKFYSKASTSSSVKYKNVRYMTPIRVYKVAKSTSSGKYYKVKYNGNYCYYWVSKGATGFSKTKKAYPFKGNNEYQQAVLDMSMDVYTKYKVKYDYTGKSTGVAGSDGKYAFDCSGFVSYVFNKSMKEFIPTYNIQKNITRLGQTTYILNKGYDNGRQFSAKTVCSGSYDYNKLQPGDVLFFSISDKSRSWDHCGIYLGQKKFIHVTKTADNTEIRSISGLYANKGVFVKAKRFVPDGDKAFKTIDEVATTKDPNKWYKIYSKPNAIEANYVTTLKGVHEVTLLYTIHTIDSSTNEYAYVRYTDGSKTKCGYLQYSKSEGISEKLRF